jgi:hypothetical protein
MDIICTFTIFDIKKKKHKKEEKEVISMVRKSRKSKKGIPKLDGSGRGTRANRGRGGCKSTRKKGRGRNRR